MSSKDQGVGASAVASDQWSRRAFLGRALTGAAAFGASGGLLAACGTSSSTSRGSTASAASSAASTSGAAQTPKRGGTLTAGLIGGGSSDTLNPLDAVTTIDFARGIQLYDQLTILNPDGQVGYWLAEEVTPNGDGTVWTIRLRPGVTFHNGKDLTADDVIYTFHTILTTQTNSTVPMAPVDKNQLKKLDKLTVRLGCKTPFATFAQTIASLSTMGIIPVGFDPKMPVGTGPFVFESFKPGTESTFKRNPNYWQTGLPYVDTLVINNFADETSQLNALQAGQVDCIDQLSSATLAALQGSSSAKALISNGGGYNPFTMRADMPPFDDVRVRQAFRLVVNREEMRSLVFGGHGIIANDLWSPWDPYYDHSLPQRVQDIEQAKSLLKQAGHSGLSVQLITSDIAQGTVRAAQVFAQQASQARINVSLRQVTSTEFYGPNYLKWPFAQDYWFYLRYFPQVADGMIPGAPYNETHFNNPQYTALYQQALKTADPVKQKTIATEMQHIDYTQGAYIIPMFAPIIDGVSTKLAGVHGSKTGQSLGNYDFKHMWRT